mmetsp:Transcript_29225/g.26623  ORF Transcript_29225/g.26623 Transcript_29225/m.26623 type:complete len:197 (+) Transcript_29225:463-1053(+)
MVDSYMVANDTCDGNTGIRMSTITTGGREWPIKAAEAPIYKPLTGAIKKPEVQISGVIFENWANPVGIMCDNYTIFRPNYFVTDYEAFHNIISAQWINVDENRVFKTWPYTANPDVLGEYDQMTFFDYTGRYNFMIKDKSANMPGGPVIVPNNVFLSYNGSNCVFNSEWNGYRCPMDYGVLILKHSDIEDDTPIVV